MSEPTTPPPLPTIPNAVIEGLGQETPETRVDHLMGMLSNISEVEPEVSNKQRSDYEQGQLLYKTEQELRNMAIVDNSLVHSASAVFSELRYYDANRLKAYALDLFTKLSKIINETPTVPLVVKKNLPLTTMLGFPLMIDPNELPTQVTVSVHHRSPSVDVSIAFEYHSGRANIFTTSTRYLKKTI